MGKGTERKEGLGRGGANAGGLSLAPIKVFQGRCTGWPTGPLVSGDVSPGLAAHGVHHGEFLAVITVHEPTEVPTSGGDQREAPSPRTVVT